MGEYSSGVLTAKVVDEEGFSDLLKSQESYLLKPDSQVEIDRDLSHYLSERR